MPITKEMARSSVTFLMDEAKVLVQEDDMPRLSETTDSFHYWTRHEFKDSENVAWHGYVFVFVSNDPATVDAVAVEANAIVIGEY